jgi:NAD+ synthase (glutamine-hydrolysing)
MLGHYTPRIWDTGLVDHQALEAGFVRVAACSLPVHLADPDSNAAAILEQSGIAAKAGAALAVFPELSLTGYSLDDLFMQEALLDATVAALAELAANSASLPIAMVVGAPLRVTHRLYNCAVVIAAGRIFGAVPKSYLPNYREFYEHRQFAAGTGADGIVQLGGQSVPVTTKQLFDLSVNTGTDAPGPAAIQTFRLGIEICEDMWVPLSPGAEAALAGAEVIANLSGSPITVAKARERSRLSEVQSSKLICGYVYAASGKGESSTDLSWDGQTFVFERGERLAEGPRFSQAPVITLADLDLALIRQDRIRQGTFDDNRLAYSGRIDRFTSVPVHLSAPLDAAPVASPTASGPLPSSIPNQLQDPGFAPPAGLRREIARFPFVPDDSERLDQDCYEAYNIQVSALVQRLTAIGRPKIVIGVSGGLDSSQALIVAAKAMDLLERPRADILAYTMPGFGTTDATKANATALANALGVSFNELDIRPAAEQMLTDMDHPFAHGLPDYDITFENVQAGLRTDYLFRLANYHGGIVLGTGDLSELALGWCTYGVGDQMSHYNVNGGVPKTLIQYLIRWVIKTGQFDNQVGRTLEAIVNTEISPELVPPGESGTIQSTQSVIGPYPLQDFALYYTLRFGLTPSQLFFRQRQAWEDPERGRWPQGVPPQERRGYTPAQLIHWLEVFYRRFFWSQFKRSALPNGPKVVRAGSLSPRGDWRQPSDAMGELWGREIESLKARFAG